MVVPKVQHTKARKSSDFVRNVREVVIRKDKSFKLVGEFPDLLRYLPEVFFPKV